MVSTNQQFTCLQRRTSPAACSPPLTSRGGALYDLRCRRETHHRSRQLLLPRLEDGLSLCQLLPLALHQLVGLTHRHVASLQGKQHDPESE